MRGFATYMPQGKLECAANVLERRDGDDDAQDDAANSNTVSLGLGQRRSSFSRNFSHSLASKQTQRAKNNATTNHQLFHLLHLRYSSYLSAFRTMMTLKTTANRAMVCPIR